MPTANDVLSTILPEWRTLLQGWSASGELAAAATQALMLDDHLNAQEQLRLLTSQWAAGDFQAIPEIVLLSAEDMNGAIGAYAAITGKIYLNETWLSSASATQAQVVLTEELGHHLDARLNITDTAGDEGELFSLFLYAKDNLDAQNKAVDSVDDIFINTSDVMIAAEAATATVFADSSTALKTAFANAKRLVIVVSGSWKGDSAMDWSIGGRYWSTTLSNFYTSGSGTSYDASWVAAQLANYLNQKYSDLYTFAASDSSVSGTLVGSTAKSGAVDISSNGGYSASLTFYSDTGSSIFSIPITYRASDSAQVTTTAQDPDGVVANSIVYEWQSSSDQVSWTSTGANASTLQLDNLLQAKYIRANIRYLDGSGFSESVFSPSSYVLTNINQGIGTLSAITGNGAFTEGVTLSAGTVTGDPDGAATITGYQWYLNGNAIASATASTYVVGAQGAGSYTVAVSYTDAQGFTATLTSAAQTVTAINNGPGTVGAITSSTPGVFQEGVTLFAGSITGDPDGAATVTAYQWYKDSTLISGATAASYAVGPQGAGNYSVAVSYSDAQGFTATVNSGSQNVTSASTSLTPTTITFDDAAFLVADGYGGLNWGGSWNRTSISGPINNYSGDKQAWTYMGLAVVTASTLDFEWKSAVFDNAYPYDTPLIVSAYDDAVQVGRLEVVIPGYNTPGLANVDFTANVASGNAQQVAFSGRFKSIDKVVFEWPTPGNLYENSFVTDDWVVAFEASMDAGQGAAAAIASQGSAVFNETVTLLAGAVTGDPDGAATITGYQWLLNGAAIAGATGSSYTTTATGFGLYTVQETYTDAKGFIATVTSGSKGVTQVNNGNGTLSAITGNGSFQEGVTLSAGGISGDPDGNGAITGYQWYFNDVPISGATSASYTTSSTGTGNYKVTVTYSDGQSYSATLTSANQTVSQVNNGNGTLSSTTGNGAFQEGVTLTAGAITGDPDGAATVTAYQWYKDGSLISGATAAAYAVVPQGAGDYSVAVSYTDAQGFTGTLTSAAQTVTAINNGPGTVGAITSSTPGVFQEGVTLSAGAITGDPDGAATVTAYQWYKDGSLISGATAASYAVAPQGAGSYTVAVSYTDAQGFIGTLTSAAQTVTAVNNGIGTVGAITSSTPGVFQEGVTLTAGSIIGDPDGATTVTGYQWYLNGSAINGASASTYAVGPQGAGNYTVAVSYTDAQGFTGTLTSAAQTVTAINNGPGTVGAITSSTPGVFQEGVTLFAGAITGDPDGAATVSGYQWYLNGTAIASANSSTYAVGPQGAGSYAVAVSYSDAQGFTATLTSAAQTITAINTGTGTVGAITSSAPGVFQEGITLFAGSITGDPDGGATVNANQWYKDGTLISGATAASYSVGPQGAGNYTVAVSYTDAQGFTGTLTSAAQTVTAINNGPGTVGAITSSTPGVFQEGVTLSAGAITGDADGAATVTAYQWYKDGSLISGATAASYAVGLQGAGSYTVAVSYTDAQGFIGTLTSAAQTVTAINNGPGTVGAITSSTPGVFQEGVTLSAGAITGDPDGAATVTAYQWYKDGSLISGATAASYAVGPQGAGIYSVNVSYTDAQGFSAALTTAAQTVTAVSNGPGTVGAITSSTSGVFQEGVTLTAGAITGDPDGAATVTAYQWYKDGTLISGATAASYAVGPQGAGNYSVVVSYTDAQGFTATQTSASQTITAVNNGSGTVGAITSSTPGVFQEGVTLSAGAITGDPDGAATVNAYQWYKDGTLISGATAASYAVGPQGAGNYSVNVSYTDAQGFSAALTTAAQTVTAFSNGPGTVGAITSSAPGVFQEGVTLFAGSITGDPDGAATVTAYQWYKDGTLISGATAASYAVGPQGAGNYNVAVSYTDAQGFTATLTSAAQTVIGVNNGPGTVGAITSSTPGVFQEGVTLSAGAITGDPDGVGTSTGYQWSLNGTIIPGATGSTYTTGAQGIGSYSVAITYSDAQGFSATLTSTSQVVSAFNNGSGSLSATTSQNNAAFTEGVILVAGSISGDPDGAATVTAYQWSKDGTLIIGATGSTFTTDGTQGAGSYSVAITYSDAQGFSTTLSSTPRLVSALNNGNGTLSAINAQNNAAFSEGVTLIAGSISGDPDGAATVTAYQWSKDDTLISGATAASYTVGPQGAGNYSVAVSYTDAQGFTATQTSASQTITAVNNGSGTVGAITSSAPGVFQEGVTLSAGAITDDPDGNALITGYQWYFNDVAIATNGNGATYAVPNTGSGNYKVAIAYLDGQNFSSTLTTANQAVNKIDNGNALITVTGSAVVGSLLTAAISIPDPDGNGSFSYQWQSSPNGSNWSDITSNGIGSTYTLTSNELNQQVRVVVSSIDAQGYGPIAIASNPTAVVIPPPDITPPAISEIRVQSSTVLLIFSEKITSTDLSRNTFTIKVAGVGRSVTAFNYDTTSKNQVILTIRGTAPSSSQSVQVSYSGTSPNIVKDLAGNSLGTVTNRSADTFLFGSNVTSLHADYSNLTLIGTSTINGIGNAKANTIIGNQRNNVLTGAIGADVLSGLVGADTFSYNTLADSLLGSPNGYTFDRITDFSIGQDKLDGPKTVSTSQFKRLGAVGTLDQAGLQKILTTTTFVANGAASFTFVDGSNTRSFVAINNSVAGFDVTKDAVVEITGYSGLLGNLSIV